MNKNYYDDLINLYNTKLNEDAGPNAMMQNDQSMAQQANVADSGSDMDDQGLQQGQQQQDDPNAMNQNLADQEMGTLPNVQQPTSDFEINKQKSMKLYDYLNDLYDYGDAFLESLKQLDIELLDNSVYIKYLGYKDNISHLIDKINAYIVGTFATDEYEKALYTYVVFRTEMIANVKALRDILKLDVKDDEINSENSK